MTADKDQQSRLSRSPSVSSEQDYKRHKSSSSRRRREKDRDYEDERYSSRHRDREREKDRERDRDRDRYRDKDRERRKDKERERDRYYEKERERDRDRRSDSYSRSERERDRDRDYRRHRERSKERGRGRESERDRDSHRRREKERLRSGSRDYRSRDRHSSRDSHADRSKYRDRSRHDSLNRVERSSSRRPDSKSRGSERSISPSKKSSANGRDTKDALDSNHSDSPKISQDNTLSSLPNSRPSIAHLIDPAEEEKIRQRRERVEKWRKQREEEDAKKRAEDEANGVVQPEAAESSGKKWSFEDDDEDEEFDTNSKNNEQNGDANEKPANPKVEEDEDEIDPLDAFMQDVESEVKDLNHKYNQKVGQLQDQSTQQFIPVNLDIEEADQDSESEPEDILALAAKRVKKKEVPTVNHSYIEYEPFTKNFYVEPPELASLTNEEVNELRDELDGIKVRGSNCPKPVKKWTHCGLPSGCVEAIKKQDIVQPTPIQSQAIPAVMAGRDVIGIAKTGSGKTLAFLLPLFRHVKDQRPLENLEGPIALILTPTRELAVQIHKVCKWFLKVLNLRAVCAYGGSPIKDNIADLKRGAEILVGTPGRMIDLLCANSGRLLSLQRVTYLVLDEADRMFDMGFEPQVMKIVNNIRPDRQTVLFSATFPRQMEALARKILRHPLEITVGGKSTVCSDVTQIVEVRESNTKLFRLLQILGEYYKDDTENSRALIFVDTHEAADNLLRDLIQKGYPCMSLHGGKDQLDRDSTIADFKEGVFQILVATSVAARGLDVKKLGLVVNYECPNHMEDYVHRVGRTGRAGNRGTAYTFITPNQERYAVDIVRALKQSNTLVPQELQSLADGFQTKVESGAAQIAGSGFGGKGLERFDKERDMVKAVQKKTYGIEDEESEDEADPDAPTTSVAQAPEASTATPPTQQQTAVQLAKEAVQRINAAVGAGLNPALSRGVNGIEFGDKKNGFNFEYEINDYPQKARWRVTNKEQINNITDATGAAITTRGSYFPAGKSPAPGSGERKLYLYIEGDSELVVHLARNEVERILKEATLAAYEQESRNVQMGLGSSGRYSVL